jgi:tetratricopeptide (TPR) repeat protein
MALGNVLRVAQGVRRLRRRLRKAIDTLKNPQRANWLIFYFRGICYERSKQWPKAEADFKRALELFPDRRTC